jgi:hypothetical protein
MMEQVVVHELQQQVVEHESLHQQVVNVSSGRIGAVEGTSSQTRSVFTNK